jgi:hypothetical protein
MVSFVGNADNVKLVFAQEPGYYLVQWHNPVPNIDHKQDKLRRLNRHPDLLFNMFAQLVAVYYSVSAGIDKFKVLLIFSDEGADAVSCNACRRLDDTYHRAGQRVKKTALANIRPTNYCYYR